MKWKFTLILAIAAASPALAESDAEILTLYRNSAVDATMRIHVATFDSSDGKDYNAENCAIAADLFGGQDGVSVRYWCEPGRYRK
jgi:hypothetical protein